MSGSWQEQIGGEKAKISISELDIIKKTYENEDVSSSHFKNTQWIVKQLKEKIRYSFYDV